MPRPRGRPSPFQAALGGFVKGLSTYSQVSMQQMLQEKKGRQDILSVLKDRHKWAKEVHGDESPQVRAVAREILAELEGKPQQMPTQLQQRARQYRQGVGPDVTGYRGFEKIGAPTTPPPVPAKEPPALKPPSPGARLVRLYDNARKKFGELNAELKTLKLTRTEPSSLLGTGLFKNQETIDREQRDIEVKERQLANVKAYMDSTVAEGRRLYGESIIFETPIQKSTTPSGRLMSKEEFIEDFKREENGRDPTERDLQMTKGVFWE